MASARIARFISNVTGGILVDRQAVAQQLLKGGHDLKTVFIVNGPWAFCDFREDIISIAAGADTLIWVQNDYAIEVPSPIRPYIKMVFSTVVADENIYVNWNKLTYDGSVFSQSVRRGIFAGLYYYGAFRKGREVLFLKYFNTDLYPVYISTTVRAAPKFQAVAPNAIISPPFKDLRELTQFRYTVYIEDDIPKKLYCSPANRFYECLSAGVAMFFDQSSADTFKKAGYDISPYMINSAADLSHSAQNWEKVSSRQYADWASCDHYTQLNDEFAKAVKVAGLMVTVRPYARQKVAAAPGGFLF